MLMGVIGDFVHLYLDCIHLEMMDMKVVIKMVVEIMVKKAVKVV